MKQRRSQDVEVRPPDQRDEWELSWYRERLADPGLLDAAVVLVVNGVGYLAVPRGGSRRGGYVSAGDTAVVWALCDALDERDGFPDVRVRWSTRPDVTHAVTWGPPPPSGDDLLRGRFFGYSDEAIARFAEETTPSER